MSAAEDEIKRLRKAQEELLSNGGRTLWKSVEERDQAKLSIDQRRGQEFSILPQDQEKIPAKGESVSRRDFFKYFTAAGALIGATACTRRPKDYLVPYVNKPEGFVYGVPTWYATTSPDGVGLLVKTREGRPIKIEGNPDHPFTKGGVDVQTQAQLLNLFNPDRLRASIDTTTGKSMGWENLDKTMIDALSKARPGAVRILAEDLPSPSVDKAIQNFRAKYPAEVVKFREHSLDAMSRANEILGRRGIPMMHFDRADVVVSVDADFLGRWLLPTEFTKAFSSKRNLHHGADHQNKLFVFESAFSITGVAADYRWSIKPSAQLKILLAIANELSKRMSVDAGLSSIAQNFSADSIGASLDIPSGEIQKAASALAQARGKSLVVASYSGPEALACQLVAGLLNDALGNSGNTIDWSQELGIGNDSQEAFEKLVADMNAGAVDVLIVANANPVFSRPTSGFEEAIKKVPTVATLSSELTETGKVSKFAIAQSHFVEAWGDAAMIAGTYSVQQPVIEPLFESRSFLQCLLAWSGDSRSDQDFVKSVSRERVYASSKSSQGFDEWWLDQLRVGVVKAGGSAGGSVARSSGALSLIDAASKYASSGMELVRYETPHIGDGAYANNAWLQELPDAISKTTWGSYVSLSPAAAKSLNLHQHDEVEIVSGNTKIKTSVFVQPGLRDDVAVMPLGYGRQTAGTLGSNVGVSIYAFTPAAVVTLSKTGKRVELATTQQQFDLHGRDHDILQQTSVAKFLKDPKSAKDPVADKMKLFTIYDMKDHPYPGHRWGMAIDLNKCTGCQACVVSCYSENNIGIVGKDQVNMGRHLGWLRLDLYYKGDEKNPSASFEPMLCQQCERAPCETVCPVLATVHSSDGLNDMSYNRCVGTRYCANNCPYKVRRFNYFHYSQAMAGRQDVNEESPLSLMFNPDVTVRSRGVMEKCTFCVQRIRKGVDEIKAQMGAEYRYRIPDNHIQTACQQGCPADAITFGDLNDENSRVAQLAKKAQAFKVLAVLNTNPSVSYLPRLRNRDEEA